jgi:hypothetical protein
MDFHLAGSRPTRRASNEYFTGTVWQDPIVDAPAPARIRASRVSFQTKGGPVRELRPGDVVWIPPGEKHWHGGSATNAMTHIAMQESLDGNHITWMEPVTDAEYAVKVG